MYKYLLFSLLFLLKINLNNADDCEDCKLACCQTMQLLNQHDIDICCEIICSSHC